MLSQHLVALSRFWLALYVNIYLVLFTYFWKCRFINTDYKYILHTYIHTYLISWCRNLAERHNLRIVLGDSPETMRKVSVSSKFQHQEIRWNYGTFRRGNLLVPFFSCDIWYCDSYYRFIFIKRNVKSTILLNERGSRGLFRTKSNL